MEWSKTTHCYKSMTVPIKDPEKPPCVSNPRGARQRLTLFFVSLSYSFCSVRKKSLGCEVAKGACSRVTNSKTGLSVIKRMPKFKKKKEKYCHAWYLQSSPGDSQLSPRPTANDKERCPIGPGRSRDSPLRLADGTNHLGLPATATSIQPWSRPNASWSFYNVSIDMRWKSTNGERMVLRVDE